MQEETFRWAVTGGVAIATLCILIMAVVAVLLYRVVSQVVVRVNDMSARVAPIIDTVRKLADDTAPKISALTSNVVEISANAKDISGVAKDQAHRFAEVGRDIADRAKAQIAHVDAVLDETVEQVQQAGNDVKAAVLKPVRGAGAVIAGVKATVNTLVNGRRPTIDHITQDEEMFI
jgi:predicted ATP-grasp superfamily ATP-dependent carboligase